MDEASILVVEDDAIIAMDLEDQLLAMGCTKISVVHTAESAVEAARSAPPDAVIMDVHLRGKMSGVEAASALRDEMNVPIIFLTGNVELVTGIDELEADAYTCVLAKPVTRPEFRRHVEAALAGNRKAC